MSKLAVSMPTHFNVHLSILHTFPVTFPLRRYRLCYRLRLRAVPTKAVHREPFVIHALMNLVRNCIQYSRYSNKIMGPFFIEQTG